MPPFYQATASQASKQPANEEIKPLLHGIGKGTPASSRWQLLARRKITELDEQIARARKMKRLLKDADRCKCLDLETCGSVFLAHSRGGAD